MDVSMECCTMVSSTYFLTGDMNGSVNMFTADKKNNISYGESVKITCNVSVKVVLRVKGEG